MEEPLAFILRRRAAFLPFDGDIADVDGRTELTDIPDQRVQDIVAAAAAPTPDALLALEQTLLARPLWLTGHRYAYLMALRLEAVDQAQVILCATRQEAGRFHAPIQTLTFAGGLPFCDAPTQQWLASGSMNAQADPATHGEGHHGEGHDQDPFAEMEVEVSKASKRQGGERRDLVRMTAVAEQFSSQSYPHLAAILARAAHRSIQSAGLEEWEQELIQRLKPLI